MPTETVAARNVRLYPRFVIAFSLFAWLPVFFLYFSQHLSLAMVLRLEALYYGCVVLLEVPSGYFSDRLGRRPTLLISAATLALAYALFIIGSGFAVFAVAQVLLATAISFRSGTDVSFHYDSLADMGREAEFETREARIVRYRMLAGAVGALAGGALGLITLELGYVLSLIGAVIALSIAVGFREPHESQHQTASFLGQLRQCLAKLKDPHLAWLFGFYILLIILEHVPYEFYQIYLELLDGPILANGDGTPLYAGIVMAISTLIGAWGAGQSIRLRNWAGIHRTLLAGLALYVFMIAAMGLVLHPLIVVLITMRSLPQSLVAAPFNAAVSPRIDRSMRATFLSLQSLAGRLAFALTLALLSLFFDNRDGHNWNMLSGMLLSCAVLGVIGLALLGLTVRGSFRAQHKVQ